MTTHQPVEFRLVVQVRDSSGVVLSDTVSVGGRAMVLGSDGKFFPPASDLLGRALREAVVRIETAYAEMIKHG